MPMYERELEKQVKWFEANMNRVMTSLQQRINAMLLNLDLSGGHFESTDSNIAFSAQMYESLMQALEEAGYNELLAQLQEKETDLIRLMKKQHIPGMIPIAFTTATAEKLAALSATFQLELAGVADDAMIKIVSIVSDTIVRTGSVSAATNRIREILEKRLKVYAKTYVNTTRARFIQNVQDLSNDDAEFYIYEGPVDDLNRPACVDGLAIKYFTKAEREQFESETADERMYNCRHTFVAITKEYYDKHTK